MAASRSALLERVERVLERGPRVRPNRLQSLPFVALPLLCIALAPSVAAESERPHERGERVLGAERDAAAPAPTRDVEGQFSPQDESVEALIESLRVELDALETHPRAASYREAFDAVRTRLDRLDELTDRLARLDELRAKIARPTPSPTTGDASAGRSFPSVPAPVTPSESVR